MQLVSLQLDCMQLDCTQLDCTFIEHTFGEHMFIEHMIENTCFVQFAQKRNFFLCRFFVDFFRIFWYNLLKDREQENLKTTIQPIRHVENLISCLTCLKKKTYLDNYILSKKLWKNSGSLPKADLPCG